MKKVRRGPKTKRKIKKEGLMRAIEIVGGVTNLSIEIGVNHGNISKWLYTDIQIPAHHVPKIVRATKGKVKPEELRPDIFII
jgi:DNA-binding transcriptional regulator YdaS (Cro superfamily)